MWVTKKAWGELFDSIVTRYETEINRLLADIAALKDQRDRDLASERVVVAGLRERLINAEGQRRAALAMNDLLTVQINQAQHERGLFLQKVLDPNTRVDLVVPKISKNPTITSPGVDFEDMGDEAARHFGFADHIPVDPGAQTEEAITGIAGQVYDPASALGAELPRFGDTPSD